MRPAVMNRLERLERFHGGTRVNCIERVPFNADGSYVEPETYRDALGNRWFRQPGEPRGQFRERLEAEAIAAASPRVARILGGKHE